MNHTGEFFEGAGSIRLLEEHAGVSFLAIAWPGDIYTRSERVE